ncbi:FAD binding domain-containing protein [Ruegeria sp.]|uniref:FAD binding domain-containing protein n=1 Tax=Ruegeria sp. TaxID=1879320 RepID=UPI003C79BAE0
MKPAAFEYVRPETLADAVAALDHDDAKIIAGGQSLLPMMNFRLVQPERLVDINRIAELSQIEKTETGIRIGALVRHAEAAQSDLLAEHLPIIREAMAHVAHVAIRNRGTVAGSLCHADPSAEWPLLVTLLNGEIEILGGDGPRTAKPDEFFLAPLVTDIEETELVTGIHLPLPSAPCSMAFDEVAQRAGDFAVVAAGALVCIKDGQFAEVRLGLGGVFDTSVRAAALEEALTGQPATAEVIEAALPLAVEDLEPNDDLHASAAYRLSLVPVLARRVLTRAMKEAAT